MQVRLTVVDRRRRPGVVDLVVTATRGATVADLIPALAPELGRHPEDPQHLYVDGRALSPTMPVGAPPLLEGAVITVTPADLVRPPGVQGLGAGLLELHVVGGPDSGAVLRLSPGRHRIGRAAEASVRIDDPGLSRVHAELEVTATGVGVRDLHSTNGTWLDGRRLDSTSCPFSGQGRLRMGSSTLMLRPPSSQPAAAHPDGEGHLAVNRRPRLQPPAGASDIRLPVEPVRSDSLRLPLMAALLPLVLAVVMWRLLDSPTMLLFGLMSPVMLLGSWISDRRQGAASWRTSMAEYAAARATAEQALEVALRQERDRRLLQHPDNAILLRTVTGPLSRLWERRRDDSDFLSLSVGTGTLPSDTTVTDPTGDPAPTSRPLHQVPVAVSLPSVGVLGVAGPREESLGVARALVAQVCGWHSPRDVSLWVLCADASLGQDWSWTVHAPHTRPAPGGACRNLVGVLSLDGDQVRRRLSELTAIVRTRAEGQGIGREPWRGPRCVVLLDGAQRLRSLPGLSVLLQDGPTVGVHFVCLDSDTARLPLEAGAVVQARPGPSTRFTVEVAGSSAVEDVVPDGVSDRWVHRFARALARLRDATPDQHHVEVPTTARLLDLFAPAGLTPLDVAARWQQQPRSTSALLGVAADGPYAVDLQLDGPHVLVGGTTGSGKSELLQTMLASLALGNRPDEMVFVLVDYKGGSAFKDCARLPHTVGLVTDLDSHLTARALTSLEAELRRREQQLARLGAKDIDDYQATAGPDDARLPRLVLVIDEFKMLAEELPAFLDGVVKIAALGRSLGVHLVLATQRPGGIVSSDIKANVNLRIALRVRDTVDSEDVLDSPAAQSIPERNPGRAYVRSGGQPLVLFQTARVGGREVGHEVAAVTAQPLPWETAGEPAPRQPRSATLPGPTDLSVIVSATTAAADITGTPKPRSPWLPPLPDRVVAEKLRAEAWQIPYALADLPRQQAQRPVTWDLEHDGHLAVAGASRTGRTSFLRALAGTIATRVGPHDVHIYAFDGAAGALTALVTLPHTGAVVTRDETARGDRLVARLVEETGRRQRLLAQHRLGSVVEQRRAATESAGGGGAGPGVGPALPYLVVLVDGWEGLCTDWETRDHGRPIDALLRVLREGEAVGIRAVITGDRSVLLSRIGAVVSEKLVLRLTDATDLLMAGIDSASVPLHQPPGRALRVSDSVEMQLALLDGAPDGPGQAAALDAAAAQAGSAARDATAAAQAGSAARAATAAAQAGSAARAAAAPAPHDGAGSAGSRPFRVDALPALVPLSQLREGAVSLRTGQGADDGSSERRRHLFVGVGGDHLGPVGCDRLGQGANVLVAGPARSGRSTTLRSLVVQLVEAGRPVVVLTARPSALAECRVPDPSGSESSPVGAAPLALLGPSDADDLATLACAHPDLVAVVDDAELFLDSPVEDLLVGIARRAERTGGGVVCAGKTTELAAMFRGITVEVRKQRLGILLNPGGYADGDLFGIRAPQGEDALPGRGLFVDGGEPIAIQVAMPT